MIDKEDIEYLSELEKCNSLELSKEDIESLNILERECMSLKLSKEDLESLDLLEKECMKLKLSIEDIKRFNILENEYINEGQRRHYRALNIPIWLIVLLDT